MKSIIVSALLGIMSLPFTRTESSPAIRDKQAPLFQCLNPDELSNDRAWWTIYQNSFPADEREPREAILRSLRRDVGLAIAARLGNDTIGLATTHLLKNPPAVLLVYLAISANWRGRGFGGPLMEYAWRRSAGKLFELGLSAAGLIWEVDSPDQPSDDQERHNRESRIAFFRRQGGQLLSRPYFQPPVNGESPVPMSLMYRAMEGTAKLEAMNIDQLVHAIYFEKYGAINRIPTAILAQLLESGRAELSPSND